MTSPVVSNYRGRAAASVHGGSGYWRMMRAAVAAAQSRRSGEVLPKLPWNRVERARCPAGMYLIHFAHLRNSTLWTQAKLVLGMWPCAEQLRSYQSPGFAFSAPIQGRRLGAAYSSQPGACTQPHAMVMPRFAGTALLQHPLTPYCTSPRCAVGSSVGSSPAIRIRCSARSVHWTPASPKARGCPSGSSHGSWWPLFWAAASPSLASITAQGHVP